ncbi:ribosome assembly factor SBDS [Candidatus Pacearchaeota archaeon]|nr:ribosome assembly factor SBDS [Candidatus Pacearchaeota archaeon]
MTSTLARIKKVGKHFEIMVDLDNALKVKKGLASSIEAEGDRIFSDIKKGNVAPNADLMAAFGTIDAAQVAVMIVKGGEVQTTQEHRDAEHDKRIKQVVDFLSANAVDPKTGNPHTPERIKSALEQAHIKVKNAPIESQIPEIIDAVSRVIPIKIETRKIKIVIPAMHTGKAYGVVSQYKDEENWKDSGDLEVVINIPAGMLMDFYNKLNSVTHGSALTEELKNGN